jgi:Na+-translocating ferredoxin:NAD+ oxidoreductase RNF subunit RnfB
MRLDPDMGTAIRALGRIDALAHTLPGRDCGACGAPSCALFAEDVVTGRAGSSRCPFMEETR